MDTLTHVVDTHAVLWAYDDSGFLGVQVRDIFRRAAPRSLGVSNFTLLEIALLAKKSRIHLDIPLPEMLFRVESDFAVVPLDAAIAVRALDLPLKQADPFDRVIVATALSRGVPLLSKDRQIVKSGIVPVIW